MHNVCAVTLKVQLLFGTTFKMFIGAGASELKAPASAVGIVKG